ncbi:MAG: metallophosphoesterase [Candidatus Woesearchaeota archaeon]|jgi:serine/threonine protein phosphatase 1|nr:metallophosphoesterase [Candidatus Woesearchaeota archaeon]
MIVISDIHGCYNTLLKLLEQLPHRNICILGDLIDRGPESYKVVDYVKSNNIKCLLGNHEDMAIQVQEASTMSEFRLRDWWYGNGGDVTVESYEGKDGILEDHINWFKTLPLYEEYTNNIGQHYILSHSNINFVWDIRDSDREEFEKWCLWSRKFSKLLYGDSKIGESINVIGHTPKKYIDECEDLLFIDTGCIYRNIGYGVLSAIDLETGEVYTQDNID